MPEEENTQVFVSPFQGNVVEKGTDDATLCIEGG